MQQPHRAGNLKQSNKSHKSRHRSKRGISAAVKGKVVKEFVRRNRHILKKEERRHQALQIRKNKRDEVLAKKRGLGGNRNPPFLVCLVPLNAQLDVQSALVILKTCSEGAIVSQSPNGILHVGLPNFKQRFSFICPEIHNDFSLIDALKIADTVLFISSALDEPVDEWGEKALALSMAQGMPTPVVVAMDIEGVHPKKRTTEKQNVQKLISKWLPEEKIMQLDKSSDGLNVLRRIGNQKQNVIHHREKRPYMLAEEVDYIPDAEGDCGTLKLSGYLRGMPLNVNGLIHITGLGDFQMSRIDGLDDPHPLNTGKENTKSDTMDAEITQVSVLQVADPAKQESLVTENVPDPMDAEQTWPTEDEIKEANMDTKKKVKKVPKGWSDYQAAWIVESDAEGDGDGSDQESEESDDDKEEFMSCEEDDSDPEVDGEDNDFESVADSEMGPTDEKYDATIDSYEEHEMLKKLAAAREDQQFPDEVDTPQDFPARERFMRFRGLESFRTSAWDPKENLPIDYARIFQFENYERTRKRVFKELEDSLINMYGFYITVHVKGVRQDVWKAYHNANANAPMSLFGLLPHEHKMSLMNVVLKRTGVSDEPIKSKERLIFQVGYRRFIVNPIFSQHTNGSKHKYERFFQPGSTCVATFFAPIQFSPSTVLCFKEKKNTKLQLVASGVLQSCNPDRLVIKRIVLSGHPYKVNKKSAVIRFMFFNRDDVVYFKPCKLRTKYGRTGHIKEPLGTHGHMKCVFDGQLKSQDTVLLNLYKRMFPKWTYEDCIVTDRDRKGSDVME
ncbi:pre-rRNA-processing protein TSR1 homolog [Pararge aegeria]|uniref:Pre-rRNA-processing protein TSR1 homolog n=2 Tax=Pararge aegeria TaxID=116150 RepID=A0A8S4RHW2_9NEOP|nr:pre-rRNA-processing protein TSR1 homolog [Pararge aegeria]CAH2236184.1 jg24079 [Pararge aegeria aegeria]